MKRLGVSYTLNVYEKNRKVGWKSTLRKPYCNSLRKEYFYSLIGKVGEVGTNQLHGGPNVIPKEI